MDKFKFYRLGFSSFLIAGMLFPASLLLAAQEQETFTTAQDAAQALLAASEHNDTRAMLKLFGPDGTDIVKSGDKKEDKQARAKFSSAAREKMTLIPDPANPGKMIISIGADDWPFPVPLVMKDNRWQFDSSEGREEILARRIGANEMAAIEICRGYVESQFEYAQNHRTKGIPEYAQRIVSSPGRQDGLYWDKTKGLPECPIPKGFAAAAASMKSSKCEPYHGYFFRILTAQGSDAKGGKVSYVVNGSMIGGFALVAWPAEYSISGVKTFMVDHEGTVFEKDLGADTAKEACAMTEYNPDHSWHSVQPE
jgi:hypothetical protein